MASIIQKKFFEIKPSNNVDFFTPTDGQNVIRFIIPPMGNTYLDELVVKGNLRVNDIGAAYESSDIKSNDANTFDVSHDNVAGIHSYIDRVEVNSRRGNVNLSQQHSYALNTKIRNCQTMSNSDLLQSRLAIMELGGTNAYYTMRRLTREAATGTDLNTVSDKGTPFAFKINVGLLNGNQKIMLDKVGGLELVIYLNTVKDTLFNVNVATTGGTARQAGLNDSSTFNLSDLSVFGRYAIVTGPMAASMNGVSFKDTINNLQVINSSNDTNGFSPLVQSMDKLIIVAQPNSDTRNNFNSNSLAINQLIGQKQYKTSVNGMPQPLDFPVRNNTAYSAISSDLSATSDTKRAVSNDAESTFHNCLAANISYPPYHSLISRKNLSLANFDIQNLVQAGDKSGSNIYNRNYTPISVSYQYGFDGYSTPFQSDLLQVQLESSVKTTDKNISTNSSSQPQTMNNLYTFNAMLNYQNLMVAK